MSEKVPDAVETGKDLTGLAGPATVATDDGVDSSLVKSGIV